MFHRECYERFGKIYYCYRHCFGHRRNSYDGGRKIPGVGKLPGDIFIKKENFSFYFPLTTCILLSIILSAIMYFLGKKMKRE